MKKTMHICNKSGRRRIARPAVGCAPPPLPLNLSLSLYRPGQLSFRRMFLSLPPVELSSPFRIYTLSSKERSAASLVSSGRHRAYRLGIAASGSSMDRHSARDQDIELEKTAPVCERHVALRRPLPLVDRPPPRGVEWPLRRHTLSLGNTILRERSASRRRSTQSDPH